MLPLINIDKIRVEYGINWLVMLVLFFVVVCVRVMLPFHFPSYHASVRVGCSYETQHCVPNAVQVDQPARQQTHPLRRVGVCGR